MPVIGKQWDWMFGKKVIISNDMNKEVQEIKLNECRVKCFWYRQSYFSVILFFVVLIINNYATAYILYYQNGNRDVDKTFKMWVDETAPSDRE